MLLSSHCSPGLMTPLPQPSFMHWLERPSPLSAPWQPAPPWRQPSSHCSTPVRTNRSPHTAILQPITHASVLVVLPSSHCSPGSRTPLPQPSTRHVLEQPSPLFV